MRLITRQIYSAFPELDSYEPDTCERFIAAAQRGKVRKTVVAAVCVGTSLLIASLPIAGTYIWFSMILPNNPQFMIVSNGVYFYALPVALIVAAILCPLTAFVMRDLLLQRRLRYVLRSRGVCELCNYSLIGLPVSADNVVTCPECQAAREVDASLGELTLSETGQARFTPNETSLAKLRSSI